MPNNPWEGDASQQPAEVPESPVEREEKNPFLIHAKQLLFEMRNPKAYDIDAQANIDPTVADVIEYLQEDIRRRKHFEEEPALEQARRHRLEPARRREPEETKLEFWQRRLSKSEDLLARLVDVRPERKMKEVLQNWQEAA